MIRPYLSDDWSEVKQLTVAEEQLQYVGTVAQLFEVVPAHCIFHVIEKNNKIVGFFNLDIGYANQYEFAHEGELGLRAFFIDRAYQGQGIGKQVVKALRPYLQSSYPDYTALVLTVNCKNPGAYQVYLKGGFVDVGELYLGGAAGPQHVLRLPLKD